MSCIEDELWDFPDGDFAWLVDPRDEVLAALDYQHPEPVDLAWIAGGFLGGPPGIEQLAVAELIDNGLVLEEADGALSLTDAGCEQVRSRLMNRAGWAAYCTRPDARPNPPIGRRLAISILQYIDRNPDKPDAKKFAELGNLLPNLVKNEQGFWVIAPGANPRADR